MTAKIIKNDLLISFLPFLIGLGTIAVSVVDGTFVARAAIIKFIFSFALSLIFYAILRGVTNYREHKRL